jgi:CHAD domain-containing protein
MSERVYRIDPAQPVPDEVRRVARGRIDHALDALRGTADSTPAEAVHEARKDMKKLRALLRLVRDELGEDVYRRENDCLRDTARTLSGIRDAEVMLATLGDLERIYGELPGVGGRLRPALVANRFRLSGASLRPASQAAIETLTAARERIAYWPLQADGFDAFEGGVRRIYRRGRRGLRAAQELPTPEHMHDWRKRVKDLWYHVTLLQDAWAPVLGALADEAHELSERLGDEHDVSVLRDWAHEQASGLNGGDPLLRGFDAIVEDRRRELQVEAFAYGARIYADSPRVFADKLDGWWEAARRTTVL